MEEKKVDEFEPTVEEKIVGKEEKIVENEEQKKLGYFEGYNLDKFNRFGQISKGLSKSESNIAKTMDLMIAVYPNKRFIKRCVKIFENELYNDPEKIYNAWKALNRIVDDEFKSYKKTNYFLYSIMCEHDHYSAQTPI
jgi:hypothetical protein